VLLPLTLLFHVRFPVPLPPSSVLPHTEIYFALLVCSHRALNPPAPLFTIGPETAPFSLPLLCRFPHFRSSLDPAMHSLFATFQPALSTNFPPPFSVPSGPPEKPPPSFRASSRGFFPSGIEYLSPFSDVNAGLGLPQSSKSAHCSPFSKAPFCWTPQ